MDKGTKNALIYTAGLAAAYLGYKYFKKKQGQETQAPSTTSGNQPPQTGAAVTQATTKPVSKAPASPTFGGASSAYVNKVKQLQTLLGVKADGILGPTTQKAAASYGVLYTINATTIDKAIIAVTARKYNVVKTATPKYTQIVKALNAKQPVRFLKDVNSNIYVFDGNKGYKKTGKSKLFTINTTLGSNWRAFGFGASGDNVLIYQGAINTTPLYEIPVNALKIV
jgi:hypothetical protein